MVMEIIFTSIYKYEVNEVIIYDLGNLFGDVGGVLGLLFGASFFTILEYMLFLFVSLERYCYKATGWRNRALTVDTLKIFVSNIRPSTSLTRRASW